MITLLGALLGFFTSVAPEILKFFKARQDNAHELAVLDKQLAAQKAGNQQRLEEVALQTSAEMNAAVYRNARPTGVTWVDGLAGTVRPVITYCFFFAYIAVKVAQYHTITDGAALPWLSDPQKAQEWFRVVLLLWNEEDQGLFAAVMTFWFGDRTISRKR